MAEETSVVLYLQLHQPHRLRHAGAGAVVDCFDAAADEEVLRRVAERCYRPVVARLTEAFEHTDGRFRCGMAISGTALVQLRAWAPDVLDAIAALCQRGAIELIGETSHHSLASVAAPVEFARQLDIHRSLLRRWCGARPTTFRNTELIYSNAIGRAAAGAGFRVALAEGADRLLRGQPPDGRYRSPGAGALTVLLRHYRLSDDIGFRFADPRWPPHPLRAPTFATWLARSAAPDGVVGLFFDCEALGEHLDAGTGILEFFAALPAAVLAHGGLAFATPGEAGRAPGARRILDCREPTSWADAPRDLSAWLGNPMQREAHRQLYALYPAVQTAGDPELLETWRRLGTSDHLYYMTARSWSEGYPHRDFSPFARPQQAFAVHMQAVSALRRQLGTSAALAPNRG